MQAIRVEDLSIDKAVELLKGKNVSRRGRRPQKRPVDERSSLQIEDGPTSASQEQPSSKSPPPSSKPPPPDSKNDGGLPIGVHSVAKKRRGKSKKKVAMSETPELLRVQVFNLNHLFFLIVIFQY